MESYNQDLSLIMKGLLGFTKSLILVLMLAAWSFAQTTPFGAMKIAVIDTTFFTINEKGIKEIIAARAKLEAELKPKRDELAVLEEKIKKLEKELDKFRAALKEFPQGDYMSLEQTSELYGKLIAGYKQKETEAKSFYDKRKAEIFADIYKRVGDAIKQFAKENGYVLVLDSSKDNSSAIIEGETIGITKEFIKYYNEIYTRLKTQ